MTAQIEQHPREGRELSMPMTWRDYLAYALAHALMAGLGFALWFPHPFVIAALSLCAAVVVGVAFVLDGCRKPEL